MSSGPLEIRSVWNHNIAEELDTIRQIVHDYPVVAVDTEFPGVVANPIGPFNSLTDLHYESLAYNVNLLRIIQLGMTFADEEGNFPTRGPSSWQFHFQFNLNHDIYAPDSIDLLARAGLDFVQIQSDGIDTADFGEFFISSGIVLNDAVRWITFHSGFDFGYILKMITGEPLPKRLPEFYQLLQMYFPSLYDTKYIMRSCRNVHGGLNDLAEQLKVPRIGAKHQAGSDSLLTMQTFFKMKKIYFDDCIDDEKYGGVIFGIGPSHHKEWVNGAEDHSI